MAKKNTTFVMVILIAVAILAGAEFGFFDFVITGSETISRTFTSEVDAGSTVIVTYKVSGASGSWAASVVDTLDCPGVTIDLSDPNGWKGAQVKKFVVISTQGTIVTHSFEMPNQKGVECTFSGNYQFGNKQIKSFTKQTIKTKGVVCSSGADSNEDGVVNLAELWNAVDKWLDDDISRSDLGEAIMDWVYGCEEW